MKTNVRTLFFFEEKKILQRNEEEKKISCRAFRRKKNILPTRLLEKKKLADQKSSTPPPPQKLNGRPLTLVKLPAYSYDLNSIEMVFAQEKAIARFSPGALSQDLMLAIVSAFEQVQPLNEGPGAFMFKSVLSQN